MHASRPTDSQTALAALTCAAPRPLDAYGVSSQTRLTAMEAGRALDALEAQGIVVSADPKGTANDLARTFSVRERTDG